MSLQALKASTVRRHQAHAPGGDRRAKQALAESGQSITLDVALKVLIVESANDVAVMIAEGRRQSGRSVQRMNGRHSISA
jgi:D-alanyl-D-alanine carboxypeptidase